MIGAERPVRACVKDLLVSLMAFVSVAVFCRYIISERVKRVLPSWMVIAIFGSLIWEMYLSASTSPVICTAVGKPPLPGFILGELLHIGKSWVLKSLLVLPIAAIVYYVSEIPKLIMRKRYR
jgi:hypothetical protein